MLFLRKLFKVNIIRINVFHSFASLINVIKVTLQYYTSFMVFAQAETRSALVAEAQLFLLVFASDYNYIKKSLEAKWIHVPYTDDHCDFWTGARLCEGNENGTESVKLSSNLTDEMRISVSIDTVPTGLGC